MKVKRNEDKKKRKVDPVGAGIIVAGSGASLAAGRSFRKWGEKEAKAGKEAQQERFEKLIETKKNQEILKNNKATLEEVKKAENAAKKAESEVKGLFKGKKIDAIRDIKIKNIKEALEKGEKREKEIIENITKYKGEKLKAAEEEAGKIMKEARGNGRKLAAAGHLGTAAVYGAYKLARKHKKEEKKFSDAREPVPEDILEKAKKSGVVQKDKDGNWRIINIDGKVFWRAKFSSKEAGQRALQSYKMGKWNKKK